MKFSLNVLLNFVVLNLFFWPLAQAQAQVLLVPAKDVGFEKYKEQCTKTGYTCTTNYFLEQIQKQETPLFDSLLNDLDYSSAKFCDELPKRILKILKEEQISIEQVEMLQKLIEQAKEFSGTAALKQLQVIEKQIKDNRQLVQAENNVDLPESFLIVFKTALAVKSEKKFKADLFKLKTIRIEFNQTPETRQDLVMGDCQNEVLHSSIQDLKWQVVREKSCSFSEQFSRVSASTSNFISQNKTSLLVVGALAVGAAVLMHNYEVQFSF